MDIYTHLYQIGNSFTWKDSFSRTESNVVFTYILGTTPERGILGKFGHNGNLIWIKQYEYQGNDLHFEKIFLQPSAPNAIFVLAGLLSVTPSTCIILRIDANGTVLWAREITSPNPVRPLDLAIYAIINGKLTFQFILESTNGLFSGVEMGFFDEDGNVFDYYKLDFGNCDAHATLLSRGQYGFILGRTNQNGPWDAFSLTVKSQNGQFGVHAQFCFGKIGANGLEEDLVLLDVAKGFLVGGQFDTIGLGYDYSNGRHFIFPMKLEFLEQVPSQAPVPLFFFSNSGNIGDAFLSTYDFPSGTPAVTVVGYTQDIPGSYFIRFDLVINGINLEIQPVPVWRKHFSINNSNIKLKDTGFQTAGPRILFGSATQGLPPFQITKGILVYFDDSYDNCVTEPLPLPATATEPLFVKPLSVTPVPLTPVVNSITILASVVTPVITQICPPPEPSAPLFEWQNGSMVQSPYLYLQAAGSDTSDGSCRGIHLLWDLRRRLGDVHLPKGDLINTYPTTLGFNRQDDYARVYKALYDTRFHVTVDLNTDLPDELVETGPTRLFRFKNLQALPGYLSHITFRFTNIAAYDTLKASTNPATNPKSFLALYPDVVEVYPEGQSFFELLFYFTPTVNSADFRYESISRPDTLDTASRYLSCRKKTTVLLVPAVLPIAVRCEMMEMVRYKHQGQGQFSKIEIVTYLNTLGGYAAANKLSRIDQYSLTIQDSVAYDRLEKNAQFTIDKSWGKYNENDPASGEFTVKVQNYQQRWSDPMEGVRQGITKYLALSQTDLEANAQENDSVTGTSMNFSYLRMLQLLSLDYHLARMLGLGHIDPMTQAQENEPYIYLAEYITEAPLELGSPAGFVQHLFLSLPTTQKDYRLPMPAQLVDPVSYGLYADNGTSIPTLLSDINGYLPYDDAPMDYVRVVNLFKKPSVYTLPVPSFFETNDEFCTCNASETVLYGLDYRKAGDPGNRKPEISHDDSKDFAGNLLYKDHAGYPEVVPIAETGRPDLYTHFETEEGIHTYRAYAINGFSRVSLLSNPVQTDFTDFPKRNSLLPPLNFAVQLIQPESPLIFTSMSEQQMLTGMTGADKTLVRVIFDWNQIHNNAYQFADQVQFLFRTTAPMVLQGQISGVSNIGNHRSVILTTSYQIDSVAQPYAVEPKLANLTEADKYKGSLLVANQKAYLVEAVALQSSNNYAQFTVVNIRNTQSADPDGDGFYTTTETYAAPQAGDRFIIYENLSDENSWDYKLVKKIGLTDFLPAHTEQITQSDGTTTDFIIGGVYQQANITEEPELDDTDGDGVLTQNLQTGVFTIDFNNYNLPALADPDVTFFKGTVRILEDVSLLGGIRPPVKKTLQVWKVDTSGSNLKLVVFDPTFNPLQLTNPNPLTDYIPIQTGSNVDVNFHPSYRAYLLTEGIFNSNSMLPIAGEGSRRTYMAARSVDSGIPCYSGATPPAVLLAQEIVALEMPGEPDGPIFATRPEFFGKSTYTFDVKLITTGGRIPYALVFYRADARKILDTLYQKATADNILQDLFTLYGEQDLWFTTRWKGLVKVDHDGHDFLDYNGYHFPLPDNDEYTIPNNDPTITQKPFAGSPDFSSVYTVNVYKKKDGSYATKQVSMADIVKSAIEDTFFPLTENPVLYKFVKSGKVTSARPPKIRNANGDLIYPDDLNNIDFDAFDPYPMVVRYQDGTDTKLRFTDYSLDGASTSFFFYYAVELSNRMEVGPPSPIAGPVQLVNAAPAEKPGLRKVTSRLANPLLNVKTAVVFEINPYIESEKIKQIQIFRTTEQSDAKSVRTMTSAGIFEIGAELVDEFQGLAFPPYGEPIYYRLVALREIINEQGQAEMIRSFPSDLVVTNVVDNLNPPAPALSYTSDPGLPGPPFTIPNVVLQWSKTVHNGYYYVYKMNNSGNWVKIGLLETNAAVVLFPLVNRDPVNIDDLWDYWNADQLIKQDDGNGTIYHHFKVVAENASGLLSLEEKVFTI